MGFNQAVSERLDLIARLMDVMGENSFRASAHARAARALIDSPLDLETLAKTPEGIKRLQEIEGVGPKIAEKVVEFAATGSIRELTALLEQVPQGLLDVMQVPGLGPKTVQTLWKQGGVTDLATLKRALEDGSAAKLPRMGEKSVQKIRDALALLEESSKRLPLGLAVPVAERIVERMRGVAGVTRAAFAGSARRGRESVGDLDVLVASTDAAAAVKAFTTMPDVTHVLTAGEKKAAVRCRVNPDFGRWSDEGESAFGAGSGGVTVQVDLRVVPESSWGAALMYFTGSKEHNVRLRERAQKMGLTLNEYGLFPEDDHKDPPQARGVKPVAGASEEEVFDALGLRWIAPELREDQGEIEMFGQRVPPTKTDKAGVPLDVESLVTVESIRAELHAHTTASDGLLSIVELAEAAKARGFHTIAVTDHSKSSAIAGGLSPDRLRAHIKAVHAARAEVPGITILAGSEVDILADGTLDYNDELLRALDIVVASPHAALSQDPETATRRLLAAIAHPAVRVLGHPTGRQVNRRAGLAPDMGKLIAAAVKHNVALEVNAHWMRLDLRDQFVRQAAAAGALIAIDCDVHEMADFANLRYGVQTARRGWLRAEQCVNTWPADRLHAWIARQKA